MKPNVGREAGAREAESRHPKSMLREGKSAMDRTMRLSVALVALVLLGRGMACAPARPVESTNAPPQPKRVAAIVTEYRRGSHAEAIVNRCLEGHDIGGVHHEPRVRIVSRYADQVPGNDISREVAARHGVPIYPTLAEALTCGGKTLTLVTLPTDDGIGYDYGWRGDARLIRR